MNRTARSTVFLALLLAVVVAAATVLVPAVGARATAAPAVSGSATSTVIPCLQVGPDYLSPAVNQYSFQQEVWLYWSGTITSARVTGYEFNNEFNAGGYGRNIYINDDPKPIGQARGDRGGEGRCRGFENRTPGAWEITNLAGLRQGRNTIRITLAPELIDNGWGISRAQIEVTGVDVEGRHYTQVTVPSTYTNNWKDYKNEGTWTHVMAPAGYQATGAPVPLLITAHGFGSNGLEILFDYHNAAAARGWLLASADYHGEVYNDFYLEDSATGLPQQGTGRRTLGSRASANDILDIVDYMQANYNVDPARIYLAGHSMGGQTALLAAARAAGRFAAVVSDSAPTDLIDWEDETNPGTENPADQGSTPNAVINHAIRTETGVYSEPTHVSSQLRVPGQYPFEYERRSPAEFAANFRHLPLLILHPAADKKVAPHHAEDLYLLANSYAPGNLQRTYFPGGHGDRIPDFANYSLDWLGQFRAGTAPQPLDFSLDTNGVHFWIGAQYASAALHDAHWLRVRNATYNRFARTIDAQVSNLAPQNGPYPDGLGVPPAKNLNVILTFDVGHLGLPASGPYTVELTGKDDGSFTQSFATAAGGKVSATIPAGAYVLRLTAGDRPPASTVLKLQQGAALPGGGGYTGAQDTYLSSWEVDRNFAASPTFSLRVKDQVPAHSAIIKFDLSPARTRLPANAKLRYAVLTLRVVTAYPNSVLPVQLDALTRPWNAGEATWNRAAAAVPWAVPGAEGTPLNGMPSDRSGAIVDERFVYPSDKVTDRYGFDVTSTVQGWLAAPATNQGFLLRVDILDGIAFSVRDGFNFASSEYSVVDRRPQLTLVYTTDDYTPTPTATPTATATPTNTPTATATPTATNTSTATATPDDGTIAGVMYMDDNRNGVKDPGETPRTGKLVQLKQNGALIDNTTTGADGRYRFSAVRPGEWQVYAPDIPAGYVLTTGPNPALAAVTPNREALVDFGVALAPTATPTATATSTPTASPTATRTPRPTYARSMYLPLIWSNR